jgi:hypothetical protein
MESGSGSDPAPTAKRNGGCGDRIRRFCFRADRDPRPDHFLRPFPVIARLVPAMTKEKTDYFGVDTVVL